MDVLNVATMTDGVSRQTTHQYDPLDRLTQADHPTMPPPLDSLPDVENFTYDGLGDRTISGYTHDANHRMRASPSHTYDYDDDGNLVVQDPKYPGPGSIGLGRCQPARRECDKHCVCELFVRSLWKEGEGSHRGER